MKPVSPWAWTALILPPTGWFLGQQVWGEAARLVCSQSHVGLGVGAACLVLCLAGAVVAWPLRRAGDPTRFIAWCAIGDAGVFGLALVYQLLAGSLIPGCWA